MNTKFPTSPNTKHRLRQERMEVIRPFVKKYQYVQLPLPEPASTPESGTPLNEQTQESVNPTTQE